MIVGQYLKDLFANVEINGVKVHCHYGDQKELNAWLIDKRETATFPLIWYVISPQVPEATGFRIDTQLILFHLTKSQMFNTGRYFESYDKYLYPLKKEVQKILYKSQKFRFENYNGLISYDKPNYGIEETSLNFTSLTKEKQKGGIVAIVDATFLEIKANVKLECNGERN